MDLEFFSGDGHLSLKLLREMVFLSVGKISINQNTTALNLQYKILGFMSKCGAKWERSKIEVTFIQVT